VRFVVVYEPGRTLIDRLALAMLTGRSVNTIRARCEVVDHRNGRALYDMERAAAVLAAIPTRRKRPPVATAVT
jgi:hypothetical protein